MIVRSILGLGLVLGVSLTYSFSQDVKITCTMANDTVSFSEPVFVKVLLRNTSKKKIRLPYGFHVKSNYLPNGLDFPQEGIELYFEISPATPEAKVFIEGLQVVKPTRYDVIKPGREKEFEVDLGKHMVYIRKYVEEANLEIPLNVVYSITCRASNRFHFMDETETSALFRDVQSEPVKFYVSE